MGLPPIVRRAYRLWIAVELGAGILGLVVVVALLPAILILLTRPALPWAALATVLAVSVPLAALLGLSGARLTREIGRGSTRPLDRP